MCVCVRRGENSKENTRLFSLLLALSPSTHTHTRLSHTHTKRLLRVKQEVTHGRRVGVCNFLCRRVFLQPCFGFVAVGELITGCRGIAVAKWQILRGPLTFPAPSPPLNIPSLNFEHNDGKEAIDTQTYTRPVFTLSPDRTVRTNAHTFTHLGFFFSIFPC